MNYSPELKVKVTHLSEEARIIRHEERKQLKTGRWLLKRQNASDAQPSYWAYERLRNHRTGKLREHARRAHVAHGLAKGMPYSSIENPKQGRHLTEDDWKDIERMVKKYTGQKVERPVLNV